MIFLTESFTILMIASWCTGPLWPQVRSELCSPSDTSPKYITKTINLSIDAPGLIGV